MVFGLDCKDEREPGKLPPGAQKFVAWSCDLCFDLRDHPPRMMAAMPQRIEEFTLDPPEAEAVVVVQFGAQNLNFCPPRFVNVYW